MSKPTRKAPDSEIALLDKGIISPIKGKSDPALGPDAFLVMVPSALDYLVKTARAQKVAQSPMLWCTFYQSNFVGKTPLTLCGPLLGAPQTVMAMEKLIVLGAERVWVLGWCGSIQAQLRIGDFLIPTHAFSEEGTSVHYPIGGRTPQAEVALSRRIERCLRLRNLPVTQGALWSTDAPYRETPRKVKTFQRKGALAVEMEMSALMTLSIYRSVGLSGLLVVSDELFDLRWHPGFKDPLLKKNTVIAAQVLLDVVASVL